MEVFRRAQKIETVKIGISVHQELIVPRILDYTEDFRSFNGLKERKLYEEIVHTNHIQNPC